MHPSVDVPVGSLGDGPVYRASACRAPRTGSSPSGRPVRGPRGALAGGRRSVRRVARAARGADDRRQVVGVPPVRPSTVPQHRRGARRRRDRCCGCPGTARALALATDGKARFCALDPRTGAQLAVVEAARNLACAGATPRALVNCLNFGNPEHPEVMWQFAETIDGMGEACRALDLPVVGGNVSFYNESRGRDIDPTPVVGVVGVIDALPDVPPSIALVAADTIVLLGETRAEVGGSEWATSHGLRGGTPPAVDLLAARALARAGRGAGRRTAGRRRPRLLRRWARGHRRRDGDRGRDRVRRSSWSTPASSGSPSPRRASCCRSHPTASRRSSPARPPPACRRR